jgi:hypothetical protein
MWTFRGDGAVNSGAGENAGECCECCDGEDIDLRRAPHILLALWITLRVSLRGGGGLSLAALMAAVGTGVPRRWASSTNFFRMRSSVFRSV